MVRLVGSYLSKVVRPKSVSSLRTNFVILETGYFAKQSAVGKSKQGVPAEFVSSGIRELPKAPAKQSN